MKDTHRIRLTGSVVPPAWPPGVTGLALALVIVLGGEPTPARAEESIAGICPDGSFFVVSRPEAAPCARPKFVPASELPPLRPEYLPRPYTWYVDQEERDENNPYNLVDKAQQMRALRSGLAEPEPSRTSQAGTRGPVSGVSEGELASGRGPVERGTAQGGAPGIALGEDELRDLLQLITLRQALAPATLTVDDVQGRPELVIRLAYSPSFERRVRAALGAASSVRVVAFQVRSEQPTEFHPRFFVTQEGGSHRPQAGERGFVLGEPGPMPAGLVSLGYLLLPERFDPTRPMTFWWNDRRIETTLAPPEP